MRWTKAFIPTLKEDPSDAEIASHKLMLRAGMIRRLTGGVYSFLPLGMRVVHKIEAIVREEMNRAGGQEVLLPILHPAELWKESGRWEVYGDELWRLVDRQKREYALGPTHEEVVTDLARKEVRSYRDLPLILYQIQTKFRDEIRPRFGVMRAREFMMKDGYSFHEDADSLRKVYLEMKDAYSKIFARCGLNFVIVEADSGAIGGDFTHEFTVLAQAGETEVLTCDCGYAASSEMAESGVEEVQAGAKGEKEKAIDKVHTPGQKTVDEVAVFLKVPARVLAKTLIVKASGKIHAFLIPGDRDLNEAKARKALGGEMFEMAAAADVLKATGGPLGFSGPVGLKGIRIIADNRLKQMMNLVVGANEEDYHFIDANLTRDFKVDEFRDLVVARAGDRCAKCGGSIKSFRGIEVGQIFELGTKYSTAMGAKFLDREGKEKVFTMGCYGIGITRTAAAVIEQWHDANGIVWPPSVAPYEVLILAIKTSEPEAMELCESIYRELEGAGFDVLFDDRDERPGAKFKDADLIGIPVRLTIGAKTLAEKKIEVKERRTGTVQMVERERLLEVVRGLLGK